MALLQCGTCFKIGAILIVSVFACSNFVSVSDAAWIVVGDAQHWTFGFNYTDWALKTAPFHENDTIVFMYDPPSNTTHPHSVYMLKNLRSFIACDLKKAKLLWNVMQGGGQGLEFVLKKRKTHYFVCGESAGFHCRVGLMKFSVLPIKHHRG